MIWQMIHQWCFFFYTRELEITVSYLRIFFWNMVEKSGEILELLYLAKDHWRGFSTQNAHMVHIVN